MAKDYEVQVKVKNGPMLRAMRAAGYDTAWSLHRATGISYPIVINFLALKKPPIRKNGEIASTAQRVADHLGLTVWDLFPEQHLERALPKNTASFEADLTEVENFLLSAQEGKLPDQLVIEQEAKASLNNIIAETLTDREAAILEDYYGLNGNEPRTLDDVGVTWNLTRERIRQIVLKAERKLKLKMKRYDKIGGREIKEALVECR
jgi:hypothetical protein